MANNQDGFEDMYGSSDSETSESSRRSRREAATTVAKLGKTLGLNANAQLKRLAISLLPGIGMIVAVILAAIVLISIMVYIFAGPDILRGQIVEMLDDMFTSIADACVGIIRGEEYAITDRAITDVAKYVENMGYDLVGSGFIDTVDWNYYNDYLQGKRTDIESSIIRDYIAAENRTYMLAKVSLSSLWDGMTEYLTTDKTWKDTSFRNGMIEVSEEIDAVTEIKITTDKNVTRTYKWDDVENNKGGLGSTLKRQITIDRETRKMTLLIEQRKNNGEKIRTTSIYNLEGWVGRFGKPIEFLLALHLGTMAPKFSQTVANEFDAKVQIRLFKTVDMVKVKYNGIDVVKGVDDKGNEIDSWEARLSKARELLWEQYQRENEQAQAAANAAAAANPMAPRPTVILKTQQQAWQDAEKNLGITQAQINAARSYEIEKTSERYTPYILSVTDHWYKDLTFKSLKKEEIENDVYVVSTDIPATKSSWSNGGTAFDVYTYSSGEIHQVAEPKESEINTEFDELFTKTKWTIMDGKTKTPINSTQNFMDEATKRLIDPTELNMQIVITMLEKAAQKSDDAKYVTRALKEYLEVKGFKFKDTRILTSKSELEETDPSKDIGTIGSTTTGISGLKELLGGQTVNVINNGKSLTVRTSEKPEGSKVYSIVGGKVVDYSENAVQIEATSPASLKGKTVIMSGINMDTAIPKGQVISKNTPIATTSTNDMTIMVRDKEGNLLNVRDNL